MRGRLEGIREALGRGAVVAAAAGIALAADLIVPYATSGIEPVFVLLGVWFVLMIALALWQWPRTDEIVRLDKRMASVATTAFFGSWAVGYPLIFVGPALTVLFVAMAAILVAAVERIRLRGAPLPAEGEPIGRVFFEGAAHAVGKGARVPGSDDAVPGWIMRQGWRRRWSSTELVELRASQRSVWVDLSAAVPREPGKALWKYTRGAAADELQGANREDRILAWQYYEKRPMFVVGLASLRVDPEAPSYRDWGRRYVFSGKLFLYGGSRSRVLAKLRIRFLTWTTLAVCAGALAGLQALGVVRK